MSMEKQPRNCSYTNVPFFSGIEDQSDKYNVNMEVKRLLVLSEVPKWVLLLPSEIETQFRTLGSS